MDSTHLRTTSAGSTTAGDLTPGGGMVPLVDLSSRTPSPYPRSRASGVVSEDEDDDVYEPGPSSLVRPLVSAADIGSGGSSSSSSWRRVLRNTGGLGNFFFGTWMGWQVYVGLLVFWVAGASFGLLLMNRFILLSECSLFFFLCSPGSWGGEEWWMGNWCGHCVLIECCSRRLQVPVPSGDDVDTIGAGAYLSDRVRGLDAPSVAPAAEAWARCYGGAGDAALERTGVQRTG